MQKVKLTRLEKRTFLRLSGNWGDQRTLEEEKKTSENWEDILVFVFSFLFCFLFLKRGGRMRTRKTRLNNRRKRKCENW